MTNRKLAYIIKDQKPLIMGEDEKVQDACRKMWKRRCGSVLIVDNTNKLTGIFTGRDAVHFLAKTKNSKHTLLGEVMTPNPITTTPERSAIDALRTMCEGGFRHLPVLEKGVICGVVSRGDFKGMEIGRLDQEEHLSETLR